jgi:hypothetical protein
LTSPSEAAPTSEVVNVPAIVLEQELKNCAGDQQCRLEPLAGTPEALRINSLIIAGSDALNAQNIGSAPTIRFSITGVDSSNIDSVSYTYIKKDSLQNIIVQSEEKPVRTDSGFYSIPLHISTLGSSIMTSAPYDQHILSINIRTASDRQNYTYDVGFSLLSSYENPVLLNRSTSIADSSYYKMDQDLSDFIIDSVDLSNTLSYAVTVGGSISINNNTVAILSNTHQTQNKTFLPHAQYYPWNQYIMTTGTYTEYHQAVASPIFSVFVVRDGGTPEEIAVTAQPGVNSVILSFSNLTLQGNEKVRMDISIHVDTNNSLLGPQGQEAFFEGQTVCSNVTTASKCSCFYYVPDLHVQNMMFYSITLCGAFMNALENIFYPNCNDPQPSYCLQQFLNVVYYPENLLALVGRDHKTDASYTITSWLKGYENLDELGSSTKTFDTLQTTKGYVDYASINPSLSYTGYIPGHVE